MIHIRETISNYFRWAYGPFLDSYRKWRKGKDERRKLAQFFSINSKGKKVFYFGVTIHPNLGDLAQRYCITNWILENYPEHELVMVESDVIVNSSLTDSFFSHLSKIYGSEDVIVLQSGYCTQDLGGNHPLMHRLVCDYMPNAKILMMPQTIYFQHEENKRICAENHNKAKNMLFLARDFVSYDMAKEMFPDIRVLAYPDIVTSLIGHYSFNNSRNGICLCTRNDGEKLYSKEEIDSLEKRFLKEGICVKQKDTQAKTSMKNLIDNLGIHIYNEIESYSHYQITITDRYHGTIFSLCAGTPVVIIKTTDHKVTTGADWFKGVYDDYVYVADSLDDAYKKAIAILSKGLDYHLSPYFKSEYYDKLRERFHSV